MSLWKQQTESLLQAPEFTSIWEMRMNTQLLVNDLIWLGKFQNIDRRPTQKFAFWEERQSEGYYVQLLELSQDSTNRKSPSFRNLNLFTPFRDWHTMTGADRDREAKQKYAIGTLGLMGLSLDTCRWDDGRFEIEITWPGHICGADFVEWEHTGLYRDARQVGSHLAQTVDAKPCSGCGQDAADTCSRCDQVSYCSVGCQEADWSSHKITCGVD